MYVYTQDVLLANIVRMHICTLHQGFGSESAWICIVLGSWIRIRDRIGVKSWIRIWVRIRIKTKIQELSRLKMEPWRLKMEACTLYTSVGLWSQIHITLMRSRIQTRIEVKSWIQIWIRL